MNIEVAGTVVDVGEVATINSKFRKRQVVIEVQGGKFNDYIPVEMTGDCVDSSGSLNVGASIVATCNLNGRRWQKTPDAEVKYFLSLGCWKFRVEGAGQATQKQDEYSQTGDSDEDIPF